MYTSLFSSGFFGDHNPEAGSCWAGLILHCFRHKNTGCSCDGFNWGFPTLVWLTFILVNSMLCPVGGRLPREVCVYKTPAAPLRPQRDNQKCLLMLPELPWTGAGRRKNSWLKCIAGIFFFYQKRIDYTSCSPDGLIQKLVVSQKLSTVCRKLMDTYKLPPRKSL